MAKKTSSAAARKPQAGKSPAAAAKGAVTKTAAAAPAAQAATPVRNTPIPKVAAPVRKEVTHEMIAQRAYEIHLSGTGGSDIDNWHRAERELRGA